MDTWIIGKRSNLSQALHAALPAARVLSASALAAGETLPSAEGPVRLVINAFQPATQLRDYSDAQGYVERAIGVTARVLDALRGYDVARLVYTSSASVYGDNIFCSEDDPVRPKDLHASLKVANEHLVRNVCRERGVPFTVARVFNMYGGHDRFSIVSKVIRAAREGSALTLVNNGNAIRDFVHIDDVVGAFVALLDGSDVETVNIASGRGTSIAGMLDALRRAGYAVETTSLTRDEIKASTARVDRLGAFVDLDAFTRVEDYLLASVRTEGDTHA